MIKNFIYLDEYKMYSLSSQLFEGVTEYSIRTKREGEERREDQKGPLGSGRTLADVLTGSKETTEKRYLHDYSYVQFEKYLFDHEMVFIVNSPSNIENEISNHSFIKVSGKTIFNDINFILKTMESINKLGEALAYIQTTNPFANIKTPLRQQKRELNKLIEQFITEHNLKLDQKFVDNLNYLLSYGFQDQLQLQISLSGFIFSSNLNRTYLRENETTLVSKYSRKTEREFTIFGIVTQFKGTDDSDICNNPNTPETPKELVMELVSKLNSMENGFSGKLPNEIVIDPIAIYTEL